MKTCFQYIKRKHQYPEAPSVQDEDEASISNGDCTLRHCATYDDADCPCFQIYACGDVYDVRKRRNVGWVVV